MTIKSGLWLAAALILSVEISTAVRAPAKNRRDDRVYRVGFGEDAPFHFRGADGLPTGVAVAIVKEAAARSGIRLEWHETQHPGIDAIVSGEVDFWVLLTDLPERHRLVHFTEPYLSAEHCFVVLKSSKDQALGDLAHARIGYRGAYTNLSVNPYPNSDSIYLGKYMPHAVGVALPYGTEGDPWKELNSHAIDAMMLNKNVAMALLLGGNSGELQILPAPDSATQMAMGSSFETKAVADRIRDEIRTMAEDGKLTQIVQGWGFFQNVNLDVIQTLSKARRETRLLTAGTVVLLATLLGIGWLALGLRRQRNLIRATQGALQQSESYHRSLVELLPDSIYEVDSAGRILEAGQAVESAKACAAALENSKSHRRDAEAVFQSREPRTGEEITPDKRVLEYRLIPVDDDGDRDPRILGVLRDITQQRTAERDNRRLIEEREHASRLESLGQLAGGVAHDFNNLLTVINGYSSILINQLSNQPDQRAKAQQILNAGNSARSLTEQLLAFSQQRMIKLEPVDLNEAVTASARMIQKTIGDEIILDLRLGPSLNSVMSTVGTIQQVLINLAANARDAMPNGGALLIQTSNTEYAGSAKNRKRSGKPQPCVMLLVRDSGSGISPEVLDRVFEPFFTTKDPGRGTGLGLATVYGIVRQADGNIEVESEPGVGTTFRIYLPAVAAREPLPEKAPEVSTPPTLDSAILLAEDDANVRALASSILRSAGCVVLEAVDGMDALAVSRNYPGRLDLLVTDLMMPRMRGTELAAQLRVTRPGICVLFMTGYASDAVGGHVFQGARSLLKPFSPEQLLEAASAALNEVAA